MNDEIMTSVSKKSVTQQDKDRLIKELFNHMKSIFESSAQSVYLYLDDSHWACNNKFALLLGFKSIEEMISSTSSSPHTLVAEESKTSFTTAYEHAIKKKAASFLEVMWKKKTGQVIVTYVILVPIAYAGELFTLYFTSA